MFIAVEGIDGSGKTTLCNGLKYHMEKRGFKVYLTKEPTGDPSNYVGDDISLFLKFTLDRYDHQRLILEKLRSGYIVISDRYILSSYSYQMDGIKEFFGDEKPALEWMDTVSRVITVRPDINILLDIDPEIALRRIASRPGKDEFENLETLRRARENYLKMENTEKVDASMERDELARKCAEIIMKKIE